MRIPLMLALAALLVAPAALVGQSQSEIDARFIEAWKTLPKTNVNVPAGGAKVVVVKFNDWMCPGCKYWYEQMKPILAKFQTTPNAIKYVEKDLPWNSECNAGIQRTIPGHEAACAAAAAVRLATDRGKRDVMAEWLYANQPGTDALRRTMPDRVKAKTLELLGIKDFAVAYQSKLPDIRKDIAEGQALNVNTTPTYFINGIRAATPDGNTFAPRYMELAIRYELDKK